MSPKDAFEILADELTLLRRDMDRLQRTSLDKDEAKALSKEITRGVARMADTGPALYEALTLRLDAAMDRIRWEATNAAQEATKGAIEKSHAQSLDAAKSLSKAAGEARMQAWRYFGGFWVWLGSMLALGALLGALATLWIGGTIAARDFNPKYFCSAAGGTEVTNPEGRRFCAMWIDPPPSSGD